MHDWWLQFTRLSHELWHRARSWVAKVKAAEWPDAPLPPIPIPDPLPPPAPEPIPEPIPEPASESGIPGVIESGHTKFELGVIQHAAASGHQQPNDDRPIFYQPRKLSKYERERLKLDKWVTPHGPEPVPTVPKPRKPRADLTDSTALTALPEPTVKDASFMMVDKIGDKEVAFYENEIYGEFSFRDTILDQLERYWVYLERMRKHDAGAFDTYSELGATIVPPVTFFIHDGVRVSKKGKPEDWKVPEMTPWWRTHRPAFGCVSYGLTARVEQDEMTRQEITKRTMWIPKFLYFHKYKDPPSTVQPTTGGDVYAMTVWWDRPQDHSKHAGKWGIPEEFAIYISNDGSDRRVLKVRKDYYERAIARRSRKHGKRGLKRGRDTTLQHHDWILPREHVTWAKQQHCKVEDLLITLFMDAAIAYEHAAYSMVRVEVKNPKENLTATFGVDIRRMSYFFRDRDITLNHNGRKQRVFHIVKPHVRHTAKGPINVAFQFRGLREFSWAGYEVSISVPGKDHFMLSDYTVGASDEEYLKDLPKKEKLTEGQVARYLHRKIQEGWSPNKKS